uniref:Putative secreted protein n=1 Tax=Ixodes ricinus TaxID=34613 RepID=A0A6B0U015_IXORI
MQRLAAAFLVILRVCSQDIPPPECRPTWYAERLGKYPDALEVMESSQCIFIEAKTSCITLQSATKCERLGLSFECLESSTRAS